MGYALIGTVYKKKVLVGWRILRMLLNVVKHHLHVCTEVISLDPDLGNLPLASAGNTGQAYVAYKWFINYPGVKGRVEKGSCDVINQGTFICLQFCFYDRKLAPI